MRKLLRRGHALRIVGAVVAVSALVGAGVALASSQFKQTAKITLTATKAGTSTGFKAHIASEDPGGPNGQPQALKTLTVTFPKNTKFNFLSKAIKQCKATPAELVGTKGAVCPSKSRIGTGTAITNGAPIYPKIPENATVYVGKGKLLFLLVPTTAVGETLPLEGRVSANKLTTTVPSLVKSGLTFVITELSLSVKTLGSGKQAFVTAGQCKKQKFTVKSDFAYYTGSPVSRSSSSKCK